jgi:hypothetical protein
MYSIEALIRVLINKGLINLKERLEEVKMIKEEQNKKLN